MQDQDDTDYVGDASSPVSIKLPGRRYRVIRKLGSGSMGDVYLAEDTKLHRRVAIKSIRADRTAAGQILRRIKRECLLHARIGAHPHIVTLFDLHDEGDQLHLVMEYVDGHTLDHVLVAHRKGRKAFPVGDGIDIAIQCLRGLAHVHARGIIHRDIKPANVMLTRDASGRYTAKIMDFGVARQEEQDPDSTTLTQPGGRSPGTPLYMAPEQIDSATYGPVVPASDLYAVGVLLYQLASGHPPFMGSLTDVFNGHLNQEPRPIRRSDGSGPHPLLVEAIEKALQKHAHRRFASAEEFAGQLESIRFLVAAGAPSDDSDHSYDDDSVLTKAWHTSATRWALAGLAGLAIAGTAFIGLRGTAPLQLAREMLDGIVSTPSPQASPTPPAAVVPDSEPVDTDPAEERVESEPDRAVSKARAPKAKTDPKPKPPAPEPKAVVPVTPVAPSVVPASVPATTPVEAPTPPASEAPKPTEVVAAPAVETPPQQAPPVLDDPPAMEHIADSIPGLESVILEDPYHVASAPANATNGGLMIEPVDVPITVVASDVVALEEPPAHMLEDEVGLEPVTVAKAETPAPENSAPSPDRTYKVLPGDTLDIIARRFSLNVNDLARWNTLRIPAELHTDQVLYLYERPGLQPVVEDSNALDMTRRESKPKELLRKATDRIKGFID